jgi:hypothetical protein
MAYYVVTLWRSVVYSGTDKVRAHDEYKIRVSSGVRCRLFKDGNEYVRR